MKLLGNRKKARKDLRCSCAEKVIDSDLTNYNDLVESIVEQYPPSYLEVGHLQYYDDVTKTFPEIQTDQELMTMFAKYSKTKVIHMFVAYCNPSEPSEPFTIWDFDVQRQPTNDLEKEDDDYLRNPEPDNEHVGVDEETLYLEEEPVNAIVPCVQRKDDDNEHSEDKRGDDGGEDDGGEEEDGGEEDEEEEEEEYEVNHAPTVEAARGGAKNGIVLFDSSAMATRSKVAALASPAKGHTK
jgi:hypothetical protein